jgi:hypothetical protein
VNYVAPQIPTPTPALRAEVARQRRQFEASVNNITRWIAVENGFGTSTALIETGDSVILSAHQLSCRYDACGEFSFGTAGAAWSVDDTTIAKVSIFTPQFDSGGMRIFEMSRTHLLGRRPGITTIHLQGFHLPSDTMPSRTPVSNSLHREVMVLPHLARIEIVPRPDTVRMGDSVTFRARVVDGSDQELRDLPVEWRIQKKANSQMGVQSTPRSVVFDSTGTQTIVARVGRRIDSLTVVVRPE